MFRFFKRKTKIQKLSIKYSQLTEESYNLSKYNRARSDAKAVEASKVLDEINALQALIKINKSSK